MPSFIRSHLRIAAITLSCGVLATMLLAATRAKSGDAKQPAAIEQGQRVFTCGHSFHVFVPGILSDMAKGAGIKDHQFAGISSIGGSRVIQHWDVPKEKNKAKELLTAGKVDVLTLSPIHLPDEGIANFATLALEHNPKIRITVQQNWLPYDTYDRETPLKGRKVDRNNATASELRKEHEPYFKTIDDHVRELNKKFDKEALFVVPVGQAVIALRERIIAGEAPGLTTQEDLFTDPIGHAKAPLQAVSGYCYYAVIYRKSPVGLPMPAVLKKANADEKLNRLLQEIAWDVVTHHPLSGVAPAKAANTQGPAELEKKTYVYKVVGDLNVQADVYRKADNQPRPVLVWIHGGALIMGNRGGVPKNLLNLAASEGYALVSIDYRLAPEVKLPKIIADVDDAFAWIHGKGAKECNLDVKRVVVAGGSAGGYLTLMTGIRVKPRPTALVAYWGYGDVDGEWYTKPSEHYRKQPLVSKEEADKQVGGTAVTGGEKDLKARGRYYLYLRQNGLWTKEVSGLDPVSDREKLDPYCPVRNVTPQYPPTMLIHGTEDTDVPYELSANMAKEFTRHKVPHELVTVPGAGHGLSGGDRKQVADANERALAFIRRHLKAQE
jgi:acetyl esterase/lipase